MKVGFQLPQTGPQASPENLIKAAEKAEELGYNSVWVLERTLWPLNAQEPYPASPDGKLPETYQIVFDPLETLSFLAGVTRKVRLGTSVIVLPYHNALQLARRISTLDVLSGGRVDIGIGIGWSRDEFQAAGVPFAKRGARTEELLSAMIKIWTEDTVEFNGESASIPKSVVGPRPVQKPHPPIYLAGFGNYTIERAAKFGAGWNPSGNPDFGWLGQMIQALNTAAAKQGNGKPGVILRGFPVVLDQSPGAKRPPLVGTLDEIKQDVRRFAEIGVDELVYSPPEMGFVNTPDISIGLTRMEQLRNFSD